jgi:spermidine synthase
MPFALIFLTGGAILALELLASRIMTPYFGVSLYIWTGILSITLVSLALGYWWGGRLATADIAPARLGRLFALMPALAGIAIVTACLVYPLVFHALALWSLAGGAFIACLLLLLVPLVLTSAMNPLLVALRADRRSGDGGAGLVFFVSTVGSVAGVLVTAFVLIPGLSNFTATLIVAGVLGALSLVAAGSKMKMAGRGVVTACGVIALAAALLLAWQGDRYTGRGDKVAFAGSQWHVEDQRNSLFGTVKILRSEADAGGQFMRLYFHDGLVQNILDSNQRSISFYTWALEALARAYQPQPQRVLMLGLGAGVVPGRFAATGSAVDVVEIDPSSIAVAQRHFGLDTRRVNIIEADARAFVAGCSGSYDVVLVDLFHGDGTPDYLITREFFRDLRGCLRAGGIAVFNTFAHLDLPRAYAHLVATLTRELPQAVIHRPDLPGVRHINSFIVASAQALPAMRPVTLADVPSQHAATLWDLLAQARPAAAYAEGGRVISDAWNPAGFDLAQSQAAFRRGVLDNAPPALLLN